MRQRNYSISCFQIDFLTSSSLLFSVVFSNVYPNSTRKKILLYLVSFCPLKSIVTSLSHIQFSRLLLDILLHGKDNIISCFLMSFTNQVEVFLLTFLSILDLHLFDFEQVTSWNLTLCLWLQCIWFLFVLSLAPKYSKKRPGMRGGSRATSFRRQWVKRNVSPLEITTD